MYFKMTYFYYFFFKKKILFYTEVNSEKSWSLTHKDDITTVHFENDFIME